MTLGHRGREVARLIRIDKPYGIFLLLFPTLWSLFFAAEGRPSLWHLIVFTLGSFLMRSAGCVMNDLADRKFDAQVARTRTRPLAAQTLAVSDAMIVLFVLLSLSLLLALTLNALTLGISVLACAFALLYPFTKRWTHLPQVVLGVTFSFGIVMAWTATRGSLALPPLLIFAANLCWATAYDTVYALADQAEDRKIGVKSTAILFGRHSRWAVGAGYALVVFFLAWTGRAMQMGAIYNTALVVAAALLFRQVYRLFFNPQGDELLALFRSNVWVGLILLIGIVLQYQVGVDGYLSSYRRKPVSSLLA